MAAHREATSYLCATWHFPIGPPQPCGSHHYTDLTCGSHQHATWQALTGPPQHLHATWQHSSNTPQHPSATWQLVIGATSQWTKTYGIHYLMPPQHTLTQVINGVIN
jgi:hypothetical protein